MVPPDTYITKFPLPDPAFDDDLVAPGAVSVSDYSTASSTRSVGNGVDVVPVSLPVVKNGSNDHQLNDDNDGDDGNDDEEDAVRVCNGVPKIVGGENGSFTRKISAEHFSNVAGENENDTILATPTVESVDKVATNHGHPTKDDDDCELPTNHVHNNKTKTTAATTESSTNTTTDDDVTTLSKVSQTTSQQHSQDSHVTFTQVEIQEYAMILGDHPDAMDGPPLTIEWAPQKTRRYSLDDYENSRHRRRYLDDLRVSPTERRMYLRRIVGVNGDDVEMSIIRAEEDRKKRLDTIRGLKNEKVDIFVQSLQRKTMRLLNRTIHPGKLFRSNSTTGGGGNSPPGSPTQQQHHDLRKQHKRSNTLPRNIKLSSTEPLRIGPNDEAVKAHPNTPLSRPPIVKRKSSLKSSFH